MAKTVHYPTLMVDTATTDSLHDKIYHQQQQQQQQQRHYLPTRLSHQLRFTNSP